MKKILMGLLFIVVSVFNYSETKKLIGIAVPETHVQRWIGDANNMKKELEKMGYKVEIGYGDADQNKQNQQIQGYITKGASAIIVGSINEGVKQAVSDAKDAKIPVISYDRLITGSDAFEYYVTFDNYKVGALQGQAIERLLALDKGSSKKTIILFAGSPTDNNARYFFDGAIDVLKKYVKNGTLTIVGPSPLSSSDKSWTQITTENWQPDKAKARMESLMAGVAKDIKIDAVLAPNDTLARAIIEALGSDAKYDKKLPVVTGQDAELLSAKWILEGKQSMTVFKDTRNLAKAAAEIVDNILKNRPMNLTVQNVLDTKTYNKDNKKLKSFLLTPVEVNKNNANEILVKSGFFTSNQIKTGK